MPVPDTTKEKEQLQKIFGNWKQLFENKHGSPIPKDYCAIDIEYSGFDSKDVITEIGHCIVRDKKAVHWSSTPLNWFLPEYINTENGKDPAIPEEWLESRLVELKKRMEKPDGKSSAGKVCHITRNYLEENGADPIHVLRFYFDLFKKIRKSGGVFIGHNVHASDERIFKREFSYWLGTPWEFRKNEVIDVGAVVKAVQIDLMPFDDESMKDYFRRICAIPKKGVHWSVLHCAERYGVDSKHNIDATKAHMAGYDAYLDHLIFEELRSLSEL